MSIRKHIPNTVTCLNIVSGCVSIYFSFQGDFTSALYAIIAASVFDFLDGFAARALKAYSDIGKELDSLCDVVSFGVAPAVMMGSFMSLTGAFHPVMCFFPLLISVFSALRLARFNLDTRQTENFIGLPVPANALFLCSLLAYADWSDNAFTYLGNFWLLPLLTAVFSYLLVSEMPFFSMKLRSLSWKDNKVRYIFLAAAVLTVICGACLHVRWEGILFYVFCVYMIVNAVNDLVRKSR